MSDYALKISVRNARLLRAMRKCGMENTAALVRATPGVSRESIYKILSCKLSAKGSDGEWRAATMAICAALNVMPDELFTERQATSALKKASAEIEVAERDIVAICGDDNPELALIRSDAVAKALATLTDRQREVIEARFWDNATLRQSGRENSQPITVERVRQVELQAMRRMKRALKMADISKEDVL